MTQEEIHKGPRGSKLDTHGDEMDADLYLLVPRWVETPVDNPGLVPSSAIVQHAVGIGGSLAIFRHQIPCRDHLHHQIPRHHQSSSRVSATPPPKKKHERERGERGHRERRAGGG
jgi:hypothetical protein